jgi:hypothetical protein
MPFWTLGEYGYILVRNVAPTHPNPSSRRREHISKHLTFLGTNINQGMGRDEARNQNRFCWRGPAAIYWTGLDSEAE